jgi:cysteine desulfurase
MPNIYLDFNASTPLMPAVASAMRPFLTAEYGNPSSSHWAGGLAKQALDAARHDVAALIGASAEEIVFTSGGTEANNASLKGIFFRNHLRTPSPHVVTTIIEHPAILGPCRFLESLGARVTRLPVDGSGQVHPGQIRDAITSDTVLVSVMHANNEVGTVQPIAEIGAITKAMGVPFHTDAAQSVGKIPVHVDELGVDLLSIAGHKLYAPKGVGALYVRSGLELEPVIHGAGHERGRRAGTESTMLTVGLGAACRLAAEQPCLEHLKLLATYFWNKLREAFGDRVVLNGHVDSRLPNTLNVSFPGFVGQKILDALDGIAASTGSACHSGTYGVSPVLDAMHCGQAVGLGAIRFSVGRPTTKSELDTTVALLTEVVSG